MKFFRSLVTRNWEFRLKKFQEVIFSWSSRSLDTLMQRVEDVKIFALPRVLYVASVLPLSKNTGQKFENLIGNFLWQLSVELYSISLSDMKLPPN